MRSIISRAGVRKAADRIRSKYNINGRMTKGDLYRVCEGEGIKIDAGYQWMQFFEDWGHVIPGMQFMANGTRYITFRSLFGKRFEPFIAAHELGHAVLKHSCHTSKLAKEVPADYCDSSVEQSANYFAEMMTGRRGPEFPKKRGTAKQ